MEVRHATSPDDVERMGTEELRGRFLVPDLVGGSMVRLVYSHHDRLVVGGVTPGLDTVALPNPGALRSEFFLQRRELGVLNVGTAGGRVLVDGEAYDLAPKECLYVGRGAAEVTFAGHGASFYLVSTPAHASHPTRRAGLAEAEPVSLGSAEGSNERTIYKYIHANGIASCQLVLGVTVLAPGSMWNTMPCHVHDRRTEVYFYFDLRRGHLAAVVGALRVRHAQLRVRVGDGRGEPGVRGRRGRRRAGPAMTSPDPAGPDPAGPDPAGPDPAGFGAAGFGAAGFGLAGRVALVTGAGKGIGRALAVGLARAGADLVLHARRDADLDDVADEVRRAGGRAEHWVQDLAAPPEALAASASALGDVDILVNNAGVIHRGAAVHQTYETWRSVIAVNLDAVFVLTRTLGAGMLARGRGKVITVASLLSFQGGLNVAAYTASKHAVAGLTRALANEWSAQGVQVNAIAPGYIETANTGPLRADTQRERAIRDRIPAGRWGRPEDLVGAAVFLASPAADYVAGHVLVVDGGWMAR
jgi:2-deoxy-D-gluconate 3-dehydrogenase